MAVDGTVGYHAVVVIKMVQQLLAGEHFSWFMRERFQQSKFCRRQVKHFTAPGSLKTTFVDNQRAFSILLLQLALRFATAQNGFDARYHFPWAVRLADIVICANLQPQQAVDLFDFCRHHHDRNVRKTTNFPAQRQAIGAREHQIQQDQIRWCLAHIWQYLIAVANQRWRIARSTQIINEQLPQLRFIFHDQNTRCVFVDW